MLISAVQKFTMLDYPDHTACIVFTAGCNFRCGYCHNPEFVLPEMIQKIKESFIPKDVFFHFLEQRRDKLEGVVVTGGEPTIFPDLIPFLKEIKQKGFLVKLDSNGNNLPSLEHAIAEKCVDYIAMDLKTILGEYKKLVGGNADETKLAQSIKIIKNTVPEYEFRSTLIKEIHTPEVLKGMARLLDGAKRFYLQTFRPEHTLNPLFQTFHPFSETEMKDIARSFGETIETVEIRN